MWREEEEEDTSHRDLPARSAGVLFAKQKYGRMYYRAVLCLFELGGRGPTGDALPSPECSRRVNASNPIIARGRVSCHLEFGHGPCLPPPSTVHIYTLETRSGMPLNYSKWDQLEVGAIAASVMRYNVDAFMSSFQMIRTSKGTRMSIRSPLSGIYFWVILIALRFDA